MPRRRSLAPAAALLALLGAPGCGDDAESKANGGDTSTADAGTGAGPANTSSAAGAGGGGEGGGGGGGPIWPDGEPFGRGDRLAMRLYDGGQGARYFLTFVDTELGAACEFLPTLDDGLRCMPFGSQVVYSDDACSEPLLMVYDCVALPPYGATLVEDGPCDSAVETLYRGGDAVDVAEVYIRSGGECIVTDASAPVVAAEEVDLGSLVGGEVAVEPLDEDLEAQVLRAEDGAFWVDTFVYRDRLCFPSEIDGATRCAEAYPAQTSATLFADDACDDGDIGYAFPSECAPPPTILLDPPTADEACGTPTRSYELGQTLDAAYTNQNETCEEVLDDVDLFALGEPLDLPVIDDVEQGTGRLRAVFPGRDAGVIARTGVSFHDTELDVDCYPIITPDGTLRCVPSFNITNGFFSDDECTEPLLVHVPPTAEPPGSGCVDSEPSRYYVNYDLAAIGCSYTAFEIWERGERYEGTRYRDEGEGCAPSTDEFGDSFEVVDIVPVDGSPVVEIIEE